MPDPSSDPPPRPGSGAAHNRIHGDVDTALQIHTLHGGVHIGPGSGHAEVPRQLPLSATGFVNRRSELAALDALLPETAPEQARGKTPEAGAAPDTRPPSGRRLADPEQAPGGRAPTGPARTAEAVVISVIGGAPGIGKTALALHWAHRVRDRFPDGDLYVNLRGHGPGPRLDAAAALESLLRTLDVAPERIPPDLDGRAALFRSRIDGKRLLILIDDALSAAQVRPLLPASPTCLVLVTSRSNLPGLVTREGARRMTLETLTVEESLALLREHLGAQRVDAEPEAARALVEHCARLPLALRVLAERLSETPDTPLGTVARDLAAEDDRLDELGVTDDELSDVRAVFAASYGALSADTARLFRSLGVHPASEFGAAACAAAAGLPTGLARRLLERLAGANLVQRLAHDRYRLHDLLRVYAVERFRDEEAPGHELTVLARLGGWYLASARNAVRTVLPNFRFVPLGGHPRGEPVEFGSARAALEWFAAERTAIVQTIRAARGDGLDDLAWRLPVTAYPLFEYLWHWAEWLEIHKLGLEAARALADPHAEARNLIGLADAEWSRGDAEAALGHYDAALAAAREAGDDWTEGFALRQLGSLRWSGDDGVADGSGDGDGDGSGRAAAQELLWEAVAVFRRTGERRGEGLALLSLAECERARGRFDTAEERARAAVDLFTDILDTWTVAWAGCALAAILASAGRHGEALAEYAAALTVFEEGRHLEGVAVARIGAGRTHAAEGRTDQAREQLGAALDILRTMEDPRAHEVEAEVAALG